MSPRKLFVGISSALVLGVLAAWPWWWPAPWVLAGLALPIAIGAHDMAQRRRALLRNYPLIGHGRYVMEALRPEINQDFVESNGSGRPFSREQRSLVYQRAKGVLDTLPFGTQDDVSAPGYEWIEHSMAARHPSDPSPRVTIGGPDCAKPYSASVLNVSAMSYGSLSANAVRALNLGAKAGGFAHNTGEGGLSDHHMCGGDLIWQIGTGYFGGRRVHNFHRNTVKAFAEILGAAGLDDPSQLTPSHVMRRVSETAVRSYAQIHEYVGAGALLSSSVPESMAADWAAADPDTFEARGSMAPRRAA